MRLVILSILQTSSKLAKLRHDGASENGLRAVGRAAAQRPADPSGLSSPGELAAGPTEPRHMQAAARGRPPRRPISVARIARHEPRAVAALLAGLRAGVGAALVRHTRAEALILARLEAAAAEFFAAAPAVKAAASAVASCPAVGPTPVRLGWRRPSAAKELWRTFRGCDAPFPAAPRRLATLARAAGRLLHRTLVACLRAVLRDGGQA